ncbi:MAG: FHA domain-containing protein [Phycisphaerae bacterium]|nr:FHA domain-containing protein [Phycisphaerae bacterium]
MRLLVKRGNSLINDLKFAHGPIYIGRHPKSGVFLPDRAVSRQHAMIISGEDQSWIIKDCDSANKTIVNGRPVTRQPLHEGDIIGIADFILEFHADSVKSSRREQDVDMSETIVHDQDVIPSIYSHEPGTAASDRLLHIPPQRLKHFFELVNRLAVVEDQEKLLSELTVMLLDHFEAYHVWVGLRETISGPLTCHGGLTRGGTAVGLDGLLGQGLVKKAVKTESYILMPNVVDAAAAGDSLVGAAEHLRSAMAAPIMAPSGAYGVIYLDNGIDQDPFTNQDLDYLTLVSTQVAALIEHIG